MGYINRSNVFNFKSANDFNLDFNSLDTKDLILHFGELNSTNTYAKELNEKFFNRNNTIIKSDEQTDGHGRLNRKWHSNRDCSLTFTLVKKMSASITAELLPLITALSLAKSFEQFIGKDILDIKWPNDLLIDKKKVAGILIENKILSNEQILFIGIGINLKRTTFPSEIAKTACSLENYSSKNFNSDEILDLFLSKFEILFKYLLERKNNFIISEYTPRSSYVIGKEISYYENGEKQFGITDGLASDGSLFCKNKNGERKKLIVSEINSVREGEL